MGRRGRIAAVAAIAALGSAGTTSAQEAATAHLTDSASPFAMPADRDAAGVSRPAVAFTSDAEAAESFDKYFVFHRGDTDFADAYADIVECDGYARGLQSGLGTQPTYYPYAGTMAGALGGAIGNVMAQAIFGSAEKRRVRRINMRTCMHFKGYDRYGVAKDVWTPFHFEEGLSGIDEATRTTYLKQQALVASGPRPAAKALGL